ncbi:sugar phosphate nucleotidyltransferase, partial [Candidatus Saccharibacteria bacterium]|nr:sugar phosphate nucleotidyltransferase [Candidatus Saccharibacteria bacterium]
MKVTKAIIPVAGYGTRWLPMTKVMEKSMLPVGKRPIVDFSVADAIAAGATDIYIITAWKRSQVERYYKRNPRLEEYLKERGKADKLELLQTAPKGIKFHFMVQEDLNNKYGTAVPVAQAVKHFFGGHIDEQVMVLMGDDFVWRGKEGGSEMADLVASMTNGCQSAMLADEVDHDLIERYGALDISEDGRLRNIVEKPKKDEAPSDFINISKYIFSPRLLDMIVNYVDAHDFDADDQEYLITDPILEYVRSGECMKVRKITGEYLDG